jgi:hypothetical protein
VSSDSAGFFDEAVNEVQRDTQGRPLIIQEAGGVKHYTRASGLGDYLTDDSFLTSWKMRYLAVALGRRRDLADLCAIETYNTGFFEPPQPEKAASGRRLDGYIARALDYLQIDVRADRGTVVHGITETGYDGYVPTVAIRERAAFAACLAKNRIVRLGSEMFTVNDDLRVAGTFDHLMWSDELGIFIGDTKNGRNSNNLGFSIQFANYANSVLYWPNGARMSLEDYVQSKFPEIWAKTGKINREVAVLFSVKDGECKTKDVDIVWGYDMACLAAEVRDARESESGRVKMSKTVKKVAGKEAEGLIEPALLEWIEGCDSVEMLRVLWHDYKEFWTPTLTNAATERKDQLS